MWGFLLMCGLYFQTSMMQPLNRPDWKFALMVLGLLGLYGLFFKKIWVSLCYAGLNVFFYGFLTALSFQAGWYISSMNFFFEMTVACWLTFRIPYDALRPD